ncbi:hypothetical protein GF318_06100 [Candidatus Micrarchaeota archaeon]|nr:hypothetical protein [Candidatus Micrarchaeota archaeon]
MKRIIAVLLIGLAIFGCVDEGQMQENETEDGLPEIEPVDNFTSQNDTGTGEENETEMEIPPDYTVDLGDTVWVNYTLWVDEEVIDTSNETLARKAGTYNPYRTYEPLMFDVVFNQGIIKGFIINVIGMKVNETVMFNVDPERGYGPYDPSKVMVVPRYYNKSLYETVPASFLEEQGINISVGDGYPTDYGTVFIDSIDGENVTLFYILTPGANFTFNGIPQQVSTLHDLNATIEYMLEINSSYVLPHPETGAPTSFRVVNKSEQNITLDANHHLANETLKFEVTLVDVQPYQG